MLPRVFGAPRIAPGAMDMHVRTQIQDAFSGFQVPRDLSDALRRAQEGRSPSRLSERLTVQTREEQNLGDIEEAVIVEMDLVEVPQKRGRVAHGLFLRREKVEFFPLKGKPTFSLSWVAFGTRGRLVNTVLRIGGL